MAEIRLEEIRKVRLEKRSKLLESGQVPYPSEVRRTHEIGDVLRRFDVLESDSEAVILLGRVVSLRKHGGLVFLDLRDGTGQIQLQMAKDDVSADIFGVLDDLDGGDWIQAAGSLTVTQRGVQTLAVSELHIISKAIRALPDGWYGLKDHETRYRQREVDLILNEKVRDVFEMRSRIITWLRSYLVEHGYVEVETPVLQAIAGGAAAQPFTTHHNALDIPLFMRVSAELYLKRLLVGGLEKVFEIGKRFRNEGVDRQHNPEFTMLESQWAHADYEDLMDFTEDILEALVTDVTGSPDITWQGTDLSFAKPFVRARYVDIVSKRLSVDILEVKDPEVYKEICKKEGLELPEAQNYYQLVDELYTKLIRPDIIQPTLLYDYPTEMVPLAKTSQTDERIAEKFQLLVHGLELNTCYTELNDPVRQREMFEAQEREREAGDEEAQRIDEEYLRAMEHGMPPNAGWSLGIDRFVMLLTDSPSIRDTVLFPLLRPEK